MLMSDKVSFDSKEVGFPCSVPEGRITHTHEKLAVFGMCTVMAFVHMYTCKCTHSHTNVSVRLFIYSTDQRQGIMRLRFKRSATAFIASIDRGSALFEPRLHLV